MERELLRKFKESAKEISEKIIDTRKGYYFKSLYLIKEVPSQEKLQEQLFNQMNQKWDEFKKHFVVEKLPIINNIKDVEDIFDCYFDIRPPFTKKKNKEFPDAFILSALDQYHDTHKERIAIISSDNDFRTASMTRHYIAHFYTLHEYIRLFENPPSQKEKQPSEINLSKPIITEDLTELKAVLNRGDDITQLEVKRVITLLEPRGSNYD